MRVPIQDRCMPSTRQLETFSGISASGGTVIDGPSIVDSVLYWGSGYRNIQEPGTTKCTRLPWPVRTIEVDTPTTKDRSNGLRSLESLIEPLN